MAGEERPEEQTRLAGIHYEQGQSRLAEGDVPAAVVAFREALRVQPDFLPALLTLGDAHLRAGDSAQALRVWERGLER
ncbi:MAG: tetratricopeptide repeat protein, partial [candidate division NC10 bacterium]